VLTSRILIIRLFIPRYDTLPVWKTEFRYTAWQGRSQGGGGGGKNPPPPNENFPCPPWGKKKKINRFWANNKKVTDI